MSATPWTPGPWYLNLQRFRVYRREVGQGGKTKVIADVRNSVGVMEAEANACLIAAAPEMAEALEQTAAAMDALHPSAAGDMNDADYARLWNSTREALDAILFRIRGDAT